MLGIYKKGWIHFKRVVSFQLFREVQKWKTVDISGHNHFVSSYWKNQMRQHTVGVHLFIMLLHNSILMLTKCLPYLLKMLLAWMCNEPQPARKFSGMCYTVTTAVLRYYPAFSWRNWENPSSISVTIASAMGHCQAGFLPSKSRHNDTWCNSHF